VLPNVFNDVPQASIVFPKGVPNSTTPLSHTLCPKFFPSHLYIPGPKGRHYISHKNFYFGKLLKLFFFNELFLGDGPSKLLIAKKKKGGGEGDLGGRQSPIIYRY
jgi:hypothetical protein